MTDEPQTNLENTKPSFSQEVGAKAERKLKARRNPPGVWFGPGMMGLIGWSVAIPTLPGAALGLWLDRPNPVMHAWPLALVLAGLAPGRFHASHWLAQDHQYTPTGPDASDN